MAISFSRPDPTSPASVSSAQFPTSRRGYDQAEVRDFLRMVAAEQARLQERERHLERELRAAQQAKPANDAVIDEDTATRLLGEEAARLLQTARESAAQIRTRAEEGSARLLREATDEAQRIREEAEIESARRRQDAAADSESELQMAKQQGRDMVNEARAYRERVLSELARRRELARQQIEQLIHGRDRLLQAFERARLAAVDVMAELTPLGEPTEFVNLSPTTGPVPLIVPMPRPPRNPELTAPTVDDTQHAPRYALTDDTTQMYDLEAESDEIEPVGSVAALDVPVATGTIEIDVEIIAVEVVVAEESPVEAVEAVDAAEAVEAGDDEHESRHGMHIVEEVDDTVVVLPDPMPVDESSIDHDRAPAPVVALFAGEAPSIAAGARADEHPTAEFDDTTAAVPSVDDLFARLRAARSSVVAEHAVNELADADAAASADTLSDEAIVAAADAAPNSTAPAPAAGAAPATVDELVVPLIVSAARKLKRVLADEQNEVLDTLRRKEPVRAIDSLLPWEPEQGDRYAKAVEADLIAAAVAGARGGEDGKNPAIVRPAADAIIHEIVAPLRDRLTRCIDKAGGSNAELANQVRSLYREWKTQRIDEHVEDIVRLAFDRGALTVASR